MTSKHYRWQTRWQLDTAAGLATHESGLRVRLAAGQAPQPENAAEVQAQLAQHHGGHNAPLMLARLLKEAGQLDGRA